MITQYNNNNNRHGNSCIEISKTTAIASSNQNKSQSTEKGPVMLLYELFSDITFNCTQTVGPQHAKFKTLVTVNGCQQFEGTGMKIK